jgi:hypothetical protein
MKNKASAVDGVTTLDHLALMIGEDEVGDLDIVKVHSHGVGPVEIWMFWIANREMAGKTIVKTLQGKGPACTHQTFLEVLAMGFRIGEMRGFGEDQSRLFGLINGFALAQIGFKVDGGLFFENG